MYFYFYFTDLFHFFPTAPLYRVREYRIETINNVFSQYVILKKKSVYVDK